METSSQVSWSKLPRSEIENLEYRAAVIERCEYDIEYRAMVLTYCRKNPQFWINTFCWTKDPKRPFEKVPFILYEDFQDDAIQQLYDSIENGEDLGIDKTRDMGVSWMVLYVFTWFWLFQENSDFRIGSRKEDFVDKIGDMDTLMEKIRFCLRYLPTWMIPDGYTEKENATYMKIINPANRNSIIGESANPHFGSGGRRKAILMDEFAKWEPSVAEPAWTSTGDVSRCRIPVSTPVGSSNKFAQLMLGTKEKIKRLSLHWTLHPHKAKGAYYLDGEGKKIPISDHKTAFKIWNDGVEVRSPWYDGEDERRSPADLAQEINIDYLRSGSPFFTINSLKKQHICEYYKRKNPFARVPYGKYITGKIVQHDNMYTFLESEHDAWVKIYELPEVIHEYVYGGDTAEGLAKGDESFGVMRKSYNRNVVATISGLIPNDEFALYSHLLCKFYNDGMAAVESFPSAYGMVVNNAMHRLGTKLYHSKKANGDEIERPGFETNAISRPNMLDTSEEEIRRIACEVRDDQIIAQMMTFIRNPKKAGRPEAEGSMLDDGVIAFAIAGQVIKENPFTSSKTGGKIIDHATKPRGFSKKKGNAGFRF